MSHRRYISEVRFGAERPAVTLFGNRTVYDHWQQIEPVCGHLLLTPQWRAAQGRVSFTWQQPGADAPLNRDEIQELRTVMNALGADLPTAVPEAAQVVTGLSADRIQQAALAKTGEIIRRLSARPDVELVNFACRTPAGPRLHSWGAEAAAHPLLLEAPKQDIRGQLVIDGGERLTGEVLLQTTRGATLERTRPDANGKFVFTGVAQGLYRVRPVYSDVFFASPDVGVTVKRDEPTTVELRGTWRKAPSAAQLAAELKLQQERKRRRRYLLLALLLLLLLGSTGRTVWLNWSGGTSRQPQPETPVAKTTPPTTPLPAATLPVSPPVAPQATPPASASTATKTSVSNANVSSAPNRVSGSTSASAPRSAENAPSMQPALPKGAESAVSNPVSAGKPSADASSSGTLSPLASRRADSTPPGAASTETPLSAPPATSAATAPSANSTPPAPSQVDSSPTPATPPASLPSPSPSPASEGIGANPPNEASHAAPEATPDAPAGTHPTTNASVSSSPETSSATNQPQTSGNRSTSTVTFVVPGLAQNPARTENKSSPAVPTNQPAPADTGQSSSIRAPAPAARTAGNSAVAPEIPNASAGSQSIFSLAPAPATSARASNPPTNTTPATGTGQLLESSAPIQNAPFTPILPGTPAAAGKGIFVPIADGAAGPGKSSGPASPGNSTSRPLAQNQAPGDDNAGGRAASNGNAGGGGGAASGAIIGGISVLGGPNVGGAQTVESEDGNGTDATDGTNSPVNEDKASDGKPPPAGTEAMADRSDAFHQDTDPSRDLATTAATPNVPSLVPANQPGSSSSSLSTLNSSTLNFTSVQPKSILLQLRWELRQEENLIAPERTAERQQLLAANQLKLPKTLRDPQTEGGIVIELPHGVEVRPPVWRDLAVQSSQPALAPAGPKPAQVSVVGNRAEFSWRGNQLPKGADYALESAEGQLWAKVTVDKNGLATVSVAPGANRFYWVGVLRSPDDDPLLTPSAWSKRLQWRTAEGKPVPREWKRDDAWRDGHGYRLEIPLEETTPPSIPPRGLGLVDALTGWVLTNPFTPSAPAARSLPAP